MGPTDLEYSELVWFLEVVMPQLHFFSSCYLENHYQLFWNLFLKHVDDCFLRRVLMSRPLYKKNYIMFVVKLSFFSLILNSELSLLPVKENYNFMSLDKNLFIVFLTDLITWSPFSPWYGIIRRCFLSSSFATVV